MKSNPHFDFSHLTPEQRVELAEDLWDSVAEANPSAELFPLTDEQRAELDRRLADLEQNPDDGEPWKVVRSRILQRLKRGA